MAWAGWGAGPAGAGSAGGPSRAFLWALAAVGAAIAAALWKDGRASGALFSAAAAAYFALRASGVLGPRKDDE
ncbi:hypothetical protein [Anaeromyxobacter paludicola]|uniref:Uncharacterized protein n=1 Tax=Anaeromyxobacter paludicola TaxID=2918171 RepID=A0ABN6NC74_9BACT|nr:hypothetical protein [Anaeromyxobacter paludicola]BDG09903.1 hypothetical protein AMPC_30160 [Anaeromyxobacter paludicola]